MLFYKINIILNTFFQEYLNKYLVEVVDRTNK